MCSVLQEFCAKKWVIGKGTGVLAFFAIQILSKSKGPLRHAPFAIFSRDLRKLKSIVYF